MAKRSTSDLNMLLGVDKPAGITSHDVVSRLRRALGERRIGHAGTLDPLASGVMVVGVGQATRLMAYATAESKRYLARIAFGRETATDDAEGETRCEAPVPAEVLDAAWAARQADLMLGMTEQVPPSYSAVQVGGVRSYAAARNGAELELAARPISVAAVQLCGVSTNEKGEPCWDVALTVSKGTYVRALARDLGRALGSACYIDGLRRIGSGGVSLSDCRPLADFEAQGAGFARSAALDPVRVLGCAALHVTEGDVADVRNGKRLSVARTAGGAARTLPEDVPLALVCDGALYAVACRKGGALVPQAVFVDGVAGAARSGTGSKEPMK